MLIYVGMWELKCSLRQTSAQLLWSHQLLKQNSTCFPGSVWLQNNIRKYCNLQEWAFKLVFHPTEDLGSGWRLQLIMLGVKGCLFAPRDGGHDVNGLWQLPCWACVVSSDAADGVPSWSQSASFLALSHFKSEVSIIISCLFFYYPDLENIICTWNQRDLT